MNAYSPMLPTVGSVATIGTPHAGRYLRELCAHFEQSLRLERPVVCRDEQSGKIVYSIGECRLVAGEMVLMLMATAPDGESLSRLQDVLARHLLRLAFDEEMWIGWHPL
jgi:hypothetical protein